MSNLTDFQTPVPVCEYMARKVPAGATTVLEPTPGRGNLVTVLSKNPKLTVSMAARNFFDIDTSNNRFDCIVMNPPSLNTHLEYQRQSRKE